MFITFNNKINIIPTRITKFIKNLISQPHNYDFYNISIIDRLYYMRTNILCLDGGGVRGAMTVELLKLLEEGNYLNDTIFNNFDIISGVSVGSMLACGLIIPDDNDPMKPKYKASELKDIFMKYVKIIFETTFWRDLRCLWGFRYAKYDSNNRLEVLKSLFGDLTLSELIKPVMIPVYDSVNDTTLFVTTHKYPDLKVVDLIMGSTAAPVYFDLHKFTYNGIEHAWIDGGLGLNNTSMGCLSNILQIHPDYISQIKILNIGTGVAYKDYSHKNTGGLISYGGDLVDILMSASNTEDIKQCKKIIGNRFMRINCIMDEQHNKTDDISDESLNYFINIANNWFKNNDNINMLLQWINC